MKAPLAAQRDHWEKTFRQTPDLFGAASSRPARNAAKTFQGTGKTEILELGGGQGRDAIFFARNGLRVTTLDYSASAVQSVTDKAKRRHVSDWVTALPHDIRQPLPFENESFDACYSHMLLCMALKTSELMFLSREVWRVLRPRGLHIYTVRNTHDAHYRTGVHRGEEMYEVDGFIVHFFSRKKVAELAEGYRIREVAEFKEGGLPRTLFRVTLEKIEG